MYAPPPAVVASAPRRGGLAAGGPLLAICCLLFILFLVAATIVLALIPVYVQRDIDPVGNSPRYTAIMTPRDRALPEGQFDRNSINNFNSASTRALRLDPNAMNTQFITATQGAGKRKRRGFGLVRERRAPGKGYAKFTFNRRKCPQCPSRSITRGRRASDSIGPYSITIDVTILHNGDGAPIPLGSTIFDVLIILGDIDIPGFVGGSGSGSGGVTGRLAG